jgi:hypothetical protein
MILENAGVTSLPNFPLTDIAFYDENLSQNCSFSWGQGPFAESSFKQAIYTCEKYCKDWT